MKRGDVWWVSLRRPAGSEPGKTRPVLVVSSDAFNASRINTVLAVALTSNLRLADAPGNVRLAPAQTGLPRPSVANVSQVLTLDKGLLRDQAGSLPAATMEAVDRGLRLVLAL